MPIAGANGIECVGEDSRPNGLLSCIRKPESDDPNFAVSMAVSLDRALRAAACRSAGNVIAATQAPGMLDAIGCARGANP